MKVKSFIILSNTDTILYYSFTKLSFLKIKKAFIIENASFVFILIKLTYTLFSLSGRCAVTPNGQRAHIALQNSFYRILHLLLNSQRLYRLETYYTTHYSEVIELHSSRRSKAFQLSPRLLPYCSHSLFVSLWFRY